MRNFPITRSNDVVVQDLGSELLIYDLRNDKVYSLNETSAVIWRACDGKNDLEEINRRLNLELKQTIGEDLVRLALLQFKKENLLENSSEMETEFTGVTRRELVRRAGLASAAALPVILSMITPTAAMAASVCMNPGGSAPNALRGLCQAAVGQPPATLAGCTTTCQNVFASTCASCATFATPSAAVPGAFECRCL